MTNPIMAKLRSSTQSLTVCGFLRLAPEMRVRVYTHYFARAIVRFTRPSGGSKARVYFRSRFDLMWICRTVYLESHPIYYASLQVILTEVRIPLLRSQQSPFKFIKNVELIGGLDQYATITDLPALELLKISIPPHLRGSIRATLAHGQQHFDGFVEGLQDARLKQEAKRIILNNKVHRGPKTSTWLSGLITNPERKFRIIVTTRVELRLPMSMRRGPTDNVLILDLEYEVDTLKTIKRTLYDGWNLDISIWEAEMEIGTFKTA